MLIPACQNHQYNSKGHTTAPWSMSWDQGWFSNFYQVISMVIKSWNLTFPWVGSNCGGLQATVANCSALLITVKHFLLSQTHKLNTLTIFFFPRKKQCIHIFPPLVTPKCSFRSKCRKKAIFRKQINHWALRQPARLHWSFQFSSTVRPLMNVYVLAWKHFPSAQEIMFYKQGTASIANITQL